MSNAAINAATGLQKYARPTLMYGLVAVGYMVVLSIAINSIPKKERKGAKFGLIIMTLIVTILAGGYNWYNYVLEVGIMKGKQGAQTVMGQAALETKIGGGAGKTNLGAA